MTAAELAGTLAHTLGTVFGPDIDIQWATGQEFTMATPSTGQRFVIYVEEIVR